VAAEAGRVPGAVELEALLTGAGVRIVARDALQAPAVQVVAEGLAEGAGRRRVAVGAEVIGGRGQQLRLRGTGGVDVVA
jgi:uncharacterized protein with PhoU and TrkA domain